MQFADEIKIRPVGDVDPEESLKSEVLRLDRLTGTLVTGVVLETAIRTDAGQYILFLTDDILFEDFLNIHLLDSAGNLLDSASIGSPYSTGTFSLIRTEPPDKIRFGFIGETEWVVEVLSRPTLRIPMISEPKGVWRSRKLRRHFEIHGEPGPER